METDKKSGWDNKWLNPNKGSVGQNGMRNERLLHHADARYDEHEMTVQTDIQLSMLVPDNDYFWVLR